MKVALFTEYSPSSMLFYSVLVPCVTFKFRRPRDNLGKSATRRGKVMLDTAPFSPVSLLLVLSLPCLRNFLYAL